MSDRIKLGEASREQLYYFAAFILGLPVDEKMTDAKLRSAIKVAAPTLEDMPALPAASAPSNTTGQAPTVARGVPKDASGRVPEPIVEVTIHETEEEKGLVPLSVNGRGIAVERAVVSALKFRYFQVLERSKQTVGYQNRGENDIRYRDVPQYPYSIHSGPSKEHIQAWLDQDAEESNKASQRKLKERQERIAKAALAAASEAVA